MPRPGRMNFQPALDGRIIHLSGAHAQQELSEAAGEDHPPRRRYAGLFRLALGVLLSVLLRMYFSGWKDDSARYAAMEYLGGGFLAHIVLLIITTAAVVKANQINSFVFNFLIVFSELAVLVQSGNFSSVFA